MSHWFILSQFLKLKQRIVHSRSAPEENLKSSHKGIFDRLKNLTIHFLYTKNKIFSLYTRNAFHNRRASSPFSFVRENARASGEAARGRGKKSLKWSLINFHLYFAQMDETTIGWIIMFRKSKLIDNRPRWPALNFRGKCRNTMLLSPTHVLCWRSLNSVNSLRKRRPAEEENLSLTLSLSLSLSLSLLNSVRDNCRLCVQFGSQGDHIGTENLFQPSARVM